jgi:hypothetical protein
LASRMRPINRRPDLARLMQRFGGSAVVGGVFG